MWRCLENLVAVAGGCIVAVAGGQPDPGTIVGGAMGAAALLAFWRESRSTHGPENAGALGGIRDRLLLEIESAPE